MTKEKQDYRSTLMLLTANLTPGTSAKDRCSSDINPFTFPHTTSEQFPVETPSRQTAVKTSGGQSLIRRRPRSQMLAPLLISGRRRVSPGMRGWERGEEVGRESNEAVVEEGRVLFSNFVYQQAQAQNPEAAERLEILTPASYTNAKLTRIGRELRYLADSLVDSPQRRRVKQKASQVSPNMTFAEFKNLLRELFAAGGITRERIVVLFLFCTDVALRGWSSGGVQVCSQFLGWSLSFISDSVCAWVQSHGGWGEVMSSRFSTLSISLALAGAALLGYGVFKYVTRS